MFSLNLRMHHANGFGWDVDTGEMHRDRRAYIDYMKSGAYNTHKEYTTHKEKEHTERKSERKSERK
jgi:tRNA(Leu) C34 or U34 (ribose-2'-O)-methylase TrmL